MNTQEQEQVVTKEQVEQLEREHRDARHALIDAQSKEAREVYEARRAAEEAVRARWVPELQRLGNLSRQAGERHSDAVKALRVRDGQHGFKPGQVVTRTVPHRRSWEPPVTERGVVEVVTADYKFPANFSTYRRPEVGSLVVRLYKRDGTLGVAIALLTRDRWGQRGEVAGWKVES